MFNGLEITPERLALMEAASNRLKKYRINCDECGEEFFTNKETARYCSRKCKRKAADSGPVALERAKITCVVCQRVVTSKTGTQKYCGEKCRRIADEEKALKDRVCERCGAAFKAREAKFCSDKCRHEALREANPSPRFKITCFNCGKNVISKNAARKFCSTKCHTEYRRKKSSHALYAWISDARMVAYVGPRKPDSCDYAILRDGLTEREVALLASVIDAMFPDTFQLPERFERLHPTAAPPDRGVSGVPG